MRFKFWRRGTPRQAQDQQHRATADREAGTGLPETGDPREEYLRIQSELVRGWTYANPLPQLVDRLVILRPQLDVEWLATVRTCTTPPPPVNIVELVPEFEPLTKTTVRLNPRPGSAANDASKIGGLFLWPQDEAWPHCNQHDMPFVSAMQLRKEDYPEVIFQSGTDLMQLLWCPNDHEPGYCPDVRVFWRRREAVTDPVTAHPDVNPDDSDYQYVPSPCRLYPERINEYPHPNESWRSSDSTPTRAATVQFPDGWKERLNASPEFRAVLECNAQHVVDRWTKYQFVDELFQGVFSTAKGTKVGGYPEWIQDPWHPRCECGAAMEHLATFSSWEFDGASWFRWLPIEERDVLCAEYRLRNTVQQAANWMFGDAGNMYVFICRNCADWPTVAKLQCG